MKVLICGGRDFTDYKSMEHLLDVLLFKRDDLCIIHGAAPGADKLADHWAAERYIPRKPYPANWARYGDSAGPIRNKQMLDEESPDLVIAFPGGRGTRNMIDLARRAAVPVVQILPGY